MKQESICLILLMLPLAIVTLPIMATAEETVFVEEEQATQELMDQMLENYLTTTAPTCKGACNWTHLITGEIRNTRCSTAQCGFIPPDLNRVVAGEIKRSEYKKTGSNCRRESNGGVNEHHCRNLETCGGADE